jgi:hypothetical protein
VIEQPTRRARPSPSPSPSPRRPGRRGSTRRPRPGRADCRPLKLDELLTAAHNELDAEPIFEKFSTLAAPLDADRDQAEAEPSRKALRRPCRRAWCVRSLARPGQRLKSKMVLDFAAPTVRQKSPPTRRARFFRQRRRASSVTLLALSTATLAGVGLRAFAPATDNAFVLTTTESCPHLVGVLFD